MSFELPTLTYKFDALEPYIDEKTMEIHYSKHHVAYISKLNAALSDFPQLTNKPIHELLGDLSAIPESIRTAVKNHGGGHLNHSLFWTIMEPNPTSKPSGEFANALTSQLGGLENLKEKFTLAAMNQFGSGWAWLVINRDKKLEIFSTPNQDSPVSSGAKPILGLDVWEHAYYLKYQNRRPDYIEAWWNVVNWSTVSKLYNDSF